MPMPRLLAAALALGLLLPLRAANALSLEALAEGIAKHDAGLSQLWPGYWPPGQPFVLYREGSCVMRSATAPDGFTAIDGRKDLWRGRCDGPRFQGPMLLGERIGGIAAPAVQIESHRETLEPATTFLLHEAFHGYQADAFEKPEQTSTDYAFPLDDELVRMKLREASFLLNAAATDDRARAITLVRATIATREARLARMPPEARALEDQYIVREGTAEYVDIRAGTLVRGGESALDYVRTALGRRSNGIGRTWEQLLRWQSYSTGAAAGLLLDGWGVDWKPAVAEGQPLFDILEIASGYEPGQQAALIEASVGADSSGIHARAKQLISADRAADKALVRFAKASKFVLELDDGDGKNGGSANFTTREMHTVAGGTLVMSPQSYTQAFGSADLDLRARSLRLHERDIDDPDSTTYIEIALPKVPTVEGCDADATVCPAGTRVRGGGLKLDLKQPHRIEREATRWRLVPVDAEA